jgi:hypothetical protein
LVKANARPQKPNRVNQPFSLAPGLSRVFRVAARENCLNSFPLRAGASTRLKPGANERGCATCE